MFYGVCLYDLWIIICRGYGQEQTSLMVNHCIYAEVLRHLSNARFCSRYLGRIKTTTFQIWHTIINCYTVNLEGYLPSICIKVCMSDYVLERRRKQESDTVTIGIRKKVLISFSVSNRRIALREIMEPEINQLTKWWTDITVKHKSVDYKGSSWNLLLTEHGTWCRV
jgi:hypothetical protein